MDIKQLSIDLCVAPQIGIADMAGVKEQGFRSIICNRPDGEGADQPNFKEIEAAANKHGITAAYLPIVAGKVGEDDAATFASLMTELPGPALAYCRTGTRSATLWSLT